MKKEEFKPTSATYGTVICSFARQQRMTKAMELFGQLKEDWPKAEMRTYKSLVCMYAILRDISAAKKASNCVCVCS